MRDAPRTAAPAHCGDIQMIRIIGVNDDTGCGHANQLFAADMPPCKATVSGFQNSITGIAVARKMTFAGAGIHNIRTRRRIRQRTDRHRTNIIGARSPLIRYIIPRPDTALRRANDALTVGQNQDRTNATRNGSKGKRRALYLNNRVRTARGPCAVECFGQSFRRLRAHFLRAHCRFEQSFRSIFNADGVRAAEATRGIIFIARFKKTRAFCFCGGRFGWFCYIISIVGGGTRNAGLSERTIGSLIRCRSGCRQRKQDSQQEQERKQYECFAC